MKRTERIFNEMIKEEKFKNLVNEYLEQRKMFLELEVCLGLKRNICSNDKCGKIDITHTIQEFLECCPSHVKTIQYLSYCTTDDMIIQAMDYALCNMESNEIWEMEDICFWAEKYLDELLEIDTIYMLHYGDLKMFVDYLDIGDRLMETIMEYTEYIQMSYMPIP